MKKTVANSLSLIFFVLFFIPYVILPQDNTGENKKLAQTGFQFLSVGTNARASAIAEAYTTYEGSSASLFHNPAGLARMTTMFDFVVNQMNWIADIKYYSASAAFNWQGGKYGVIGFTFLYVDYGKFEWTIVDPTSPKGYQDVDAGWAMPNAFSIGLGYAKELSDKFSVGGQIKYVRQKLGTSYVPVYTGNKLTGQEEKDYALGVVAFDFGTLYKTGFKSLAFGMSIRNFAEEVKYEKESFQLPLTFRIGIGMNVMDFFPQWSESNALNITIDAVHPRSFPEYVAFGGEYVFKNILYLRAGYVTNQDDYSYSFGAGVRSFGFAFDYSYTPFSTFQDVNRFTIKFAF
jgi:hypothetical protein